MFYELVYIVSLEVKFLESIIRCIVNIDFIVSEIIRLSLLQVSDRP